MVENKIYNTETFSLEKSQDKKGYILKGNAMPLGETSRNGVYYRPESVKKAYKSLEGNSFLFSHQQDQVNHVLGHVTKADLTDTHVTYEVDIDPEEKDFIRKSERGDIKHVSVGAIINPETVEIDEDKGIAYVDVEEFAELSSAPVPGYKNTSAKLNTVMAIAEKFGNEDQVKKLKQKTKTKETDEDKDTEDNPEEDKLPGQADTEEPKDKEDKKETEESEEDKEDTEDSEDKEDTKEPEEQEVTESYQEDKEESEADKEDNEEDKSEEDMSKEPFAGYKNFDDCVKKNQDKKDPKAYCGKIQKKAKDKDNKTQNTSNETEDESEEQTVEEQVSELKTLYDEISGKYEEIQNRLSALESKIDQLLDEPEEENSKEQDTQKLKEVYNEEKFQEKSDLTPNIKPEKYQERKEKELGLDKNTDGKKLDSIDLNKIIRKNRRY
ncbi:MAG: hypothetical protein ACOCTT_01905 [archaeon]